MDDAALARAYIDRVWLGLPGGGPPPFAPGARLHAQDHDRVATPDALAAEAAMLRETVPDLSVGIDLCFRDGPVLVLGTTLAGHAGGRPVRWSALEMAETAGGTITALWRVEERLLMRIQAGLAVAPFGGAPDGTPLPPFPDPARRSPFLAGTATPCPGAARLGIRRALAREHIEEMWGKGQGHLAHRLYAPDVADHNPAPGQRPGIPGILDVLDWLQAAASGLRMAVHRLAVAGPFAADRWTLAGTHDRGPLLGLPPRGRPFRFHGMDVVRFRDDDRIGDVWHVEAFDRLREQIG